ncbi:MAG: hypothetical protein RLO51_13755 [Thalassobaculum sp.]|uniref:hypothetical protein n=1 Tax=Thalassobaculum sp. TaxID=2022740 RepID=UPI0032F08A6C
MTRTTSLSTAEINRLAAHGRALQGRAVRSSFAGMGRWFLRIANAAFGRRATVHLGCSDCGAHA